MVCGFFECKVQKLANGRGSNVQARITGGIINIHLTVIIRNSTIGKYHVGNIADALPATRRDQKSGRFGNHFPRLHNGLVGGGAVFIRLSEPFAAGAGIDHLIQGNTA